MGQNKAPPRAAPWATAGVLPLRSAPESYLMVKAKIMAPRDAVSGQGEEMLTTMQAKRGEREGPL